jgi:hypothetical protein
MGCCRSSPATTPGRTSGVVFREHLERVGRRPRTRRAGGPTAFRNVCNGSEVPLLRISTFAPGFFASRPSCTPPSVPSGTGDDSDLLLGRCERRAGGKQRGDRRTDRMIGEAGSIGPPPDVGCAGIVGGMKPANARPMQRPGQTSNAKSPGVSTGAGFGCGGGSGMSRIRVPRFTSSCARSAWRRRPRAW